MTIRSDFDVASADGRGFAVSGGVAKAVVNVIKDKYPDREVNVESAEGLEECRVMMKAAAQGELNGYLLEGMACPGGCIAGAGTLAPIQKHAAMVGMYARRFPTSMQMRAVLREIFLSLCAKTITRILAPTRSPKPKTLWERLIRSLRMACLTSLKS